MRRLLLGLVAIALTLCTLGGSPSPSSALDRATETNLEREFAAVLTRVASIRETNRLTAIDVKNLFKPITDNYSLSDFRDFLAARFKFERAWMAVIGNSEYTHIGPLQLKLFDGRFSVVDRVTIGFDYDSEWKKIVGFHAGLGGEDLFGEGMILTVVVYFAVAIVISATFVAAIIILRKAGYSEGWALLLLAFMITVFAMWWFGLVGMRTW